MAVDLDSAFKETKQNLESGRKSFEDRLQRQQADDRSHLARLIIDVFVGLVAWLVLAVSIATYWWEWEAIAEPAKFVMAILSSVLLPVVTLVIGYYFSSK